MPHFVSGFKSSGNPALRRLDFEEFNFDDVFLIGYTKDSVEDTITQKEFWDIEEPYLYNKSKVFECNGNCISKLDKMMLSLETMDSCEITT